MATHFLNIQGKIADLEDMKREYEKRVVDAEFEGDTQTASQYRGYIQETDNKIFGMKNSPYYNSEKET